MGRILHYAIVKADGTHEVVECEYPIEYKALTEAVKGPDGDPGYIEAIRNEHSTIYLNENGKYLKLESNVAITRYARRHQMIFPNDIVMGDCVLVGPTDEEGYDLEFNRAVLDEILNLL